MKPENMRVNVDRGDGQGSQQPAMKMTIFQSSAWAIGVALAAGNLSAKTQIPNAAQPQLAVSAVGNSLVAYASSDAGKTWSGPVTINDVATSAREGLHDLAAAPDGRLFVTWLDLRNGTMALWSAESGDGGKTWSKNAEVYRS